MINTQLTFLIRRGKSSGEDSAPEELRILMVSLFGSKKVKTEVIRCESYQVKRSRDGSPGR